MKIGIITRHLDLPVGFGTYANRLLEALAEVDRDNQYIIYTPHAPKRHRWPANFSFHDFGLSQVRSRLARWEHFAAPLAAKRDGVDLVHYLHTACPIPRIRRPVLVGVLDAIGWVLPEYRLPLPYMLLARRDIHFASHLLTISENAKVDLERQLRLHPRKISVTPLAGPPANRPAAQSKSAAAKPYWLFIGGLEKRKNLRVLFEAVAGMAGGVDWRIKVVGPTNPAPLHEDKSELLQLLRPDQRRRVDWLGRVNDAELAKLYRQATALVFPSLYEGFGLPVLEAMAHHTPVIAADTSSIPEIAGGAALLFDPHDAATLADHLQSVADDAKLRARLVKRGLAVTGGYSWQRTARQTLEVYQKMLGS